LLELHSWVEAYLDGEWLRPRRNDLEPKLNPNARSRLFPLCCKI
jgi:hypothetical protein